MISFKHHANISIATLVNRKFTSITNASLGLAANRQGGNQLSYTSFFPILFGFCTLNKFTFARYKSLFFAHV